MSFTTIYMIKSSFLVPNSITIHIVYICGTIVEISASLLYKLVGVYDSNLDSAYSDEFSVPLRHCSHFHHWKGAESVQFESEVTSTHIFRWIDMDRDCLLSVVHFVPENYSGVPSFCRMTAKHGIMRRTNYIFIIWRRQLLRSCTSQSKCQLAGCSLSKGNVNCTSEQVDEHILSA